MQGSIRKKTEVTLNSGNRLKRMQRQLAQPATPFLRASIQNNLTKTKGHGVDAPPVSVSWFGLALLALLAFTLVAWAPTAHAQALSLAPPSPKLPATVSVRELQIPPKARDAFRQGLQRLSQGDPAGSLKHFSKALQNFPEYYEAYYNQGVAQMKLDRKSEALQSFQRVGSSDADKKYIRVALGVARRLAAKNPETMRPDKND